MTKAADRNRVILVTGGAGFIGTNLAERLLQQANVTVRVFDDLSRHGVVQNLRWLSSLDTPGVLEFIAGDVRDAKALAMAANGVSEIYHLAAQVAVTTSVESPRSDFEVNALGTFNVLEAARRSDMRPFTLFTSTNKVYGALSSVPVSLTGSHYSATLPGFNGVTESQRLDFHSPYGCSKGAADQYVRDYARIYDLPTVVFRMSCIAGPHQFGNEDQGWVAHFLYSVLEGRPITVYGDGFQVRDVLHVSDLIDAMIAAQTCQSVTGGRIYNLGGGLSRSVSIFEMLEAIKRETGIEPQVLRGDVRPGDQPLYISDTTRLTSDTGWRAHHDLPRILHDIHLFWQSQRRLPHLQRDSQSTTRLVAEGVA